MTNNNFLKLTPWDSIIFGIPTGELLEYSKDALSDAQSRPGHYTIKVDPLVDKKLLSDYRFYYCDTLIEPICDSVRFRASTNALAEISNNVTYDQVLDVCHGAFLHGRFNRDFNLSNELANKRYDRWLKQLVEEKQTYGLYWDGIFAGFICFSGSCLVLHAISEKFRGQGLAKYWWSAVCEKLFQNGSTSIKSSISATNLPVLNLYASLGFYFSNPKDVYHSLVK